MQERRISPVRARTAEEVGRALGRGLAVETTPEIAAECGADFGDAEQLEDVLEAHRRPYGDLEPPEGGAA